MKKAVSRPKAMPPPRRGSRRTSPALLSPDHLPSDWGVIFLPTAGRAMTGVVVVAESKDGRQFKTRTDEEGRFQFKELPPADYAVSPKLPRKMQLYDLGFTQVEGSKKYVRIDDQLCSRELRFVAQEAGSVVGRIELVGGKRTDGEPLLYLHGIDPKTHKFDFEGGACVRLRTVTYKNHLLG